MNEVHKIKLELSSLTNKVKQLSRVINKQKLSGKQIETYSNRLSTLNEQIRVLKREEELIVSLLKEKKIFKLKKDIKINKCVVAKKGMKVFCNDITFFYDPKFYCFQVVNKKTNYSFWVDELEFDEYLEKL